LRAATISVSICPAPPEISKAWKNSKSTWKPNRAASSPRRCCQSGSRGQAASSSKKKPAASKSGGLSDLDLAPLDSQLGSDINLGGKEGSSGALAGLSALELDDDDQVLATAAM